MCASKDCVELIVLYYILIIFIEVIGHLLRIFYNYLKEWFRTKEEELCENFKGFYEIAGIAPILRTIL